MDLLVVSRALRQRDMDLVDHMIGAAFDHGAAVEEIGADVASRLDAEGEGVAARLRYTVQVESDEAPAVHVRGGLCLRG